MYLNKVSKHFYDFSEKEEKKEEEKKSSMGGGGDEASATTKKIFNDEPTTLLKRDYVNEFAIKTIKDKKQYVINFSDDFDPNPNISSDLACSRYERMKLKDPDNKSNRIAPDILMV